MRRAAGEARRASDEMSDRAFLRMTELASVAAPEGEAETRAVLAARKVLGAYTEEVVELAGDRDRLAFPAPTPAGPSCALRADERREGLPGGAALALAPEAEAGLLLGPRVL